MGAIWMPRICLVTSLSELVGYKAGVALNRDEMRGFLNDDAPELLDGADDDMLRIRAGEFDEYLARLLYSVGNIPSPSTMPRRLQIYHRVKTDPELLLLYEAIAGEFANFLERAIDDNEKSGGRSIDPTPFVEWAKTNHGPIGAAMAIEFLEGLNADQHRSFLVPFRQVEWKDVTQLAELFRSENLDTSHGKFFDQRFIDFLSQSFESIDLINWRKFEALTCEFFDKLGFHVEIGEGRNDDNVDARIWPAEASKDSPPLMLVQCKREKEKVGKVVVKALYADVVHENATLGLIVTTSAISPGAKKVCRARSYPVEEANRQTLKDWIAVMRTPYRGIFLGE